MADELPEEFRPKPAKRLHDDPSALKEAFAQAPESLAIGGGKAGNELQDECAGVLAELLESGSCSLVALHIFGGLTDGCAPALAAIAQNTSLRTLKLCGGLKDAAGAALAEALKGNAGLETLQLYGGLQDQDQKPLPPGISEATGAALGDALKVNTSLKTLQLGSGVSAEGITHMLRALSENKTLTTLNLFMGGLPDAVATELAIVLKDSQTLKSLQLAGDISYEAGNALSHAIYANTALWDLQLGARVSSPGAFRLLMVWNGRGMKQSLLSAAEMQAQEEEALRSARKEYELSYDSAPLIRRKFVYQGHSIKQGRLVF